MLFLDIETVAAAASFQELPERLQKHWERKSSFIKREEKSAEELFDEKAGIYAEFGKIVCIGMGYITQSEAPGKTAALRIKSLYDHDENALLNSFSKVISTRFDPEKLILCAHNGKEFDFPYLCRRMVVQGIKLPPSLQLSGKKPWDIKHVDTLELWKFGDYKNFTSLDLLATLFNIETSKVGLDGSMVNHTYYKEGDLSAVAEYCSRDVAVLAQLYLKLTQAMPLEELEVVYTGV